MPIVNFHLLDQEYCCDQQEQLLLEASRLYAEVLRCPIDRVRAFISLYPARQMAVGGVLCSARRQSAPYFTFIVLEGRPLEERQRLLAGFTDLLERILGAPRELIRGGVTRIEPEDWAIGGVPASVERQAEVQARAKAAQAATNFRVKEDG